MPQYREDGLTKTETFMKKAGIPGPVFKEMIYYRNINGLVDCGAVVPVKMVNNDLLIDEAKFAAWLKENQRVMLAST